MTGNIENNRSVNPHLKADLDGLIPILNPYSTVNNSLKVDLWKDCGPDNKCQADLQLELQEPSMTVDEEDRNYILADEQAEMNLEFEMTLIGEWSYGTILEIEHSNYRNGTRLKFLQAEHDGDMFNLNCEQKTDTVRDPQPSKFEMGPWPL